MVPQLQDDALDPGLTRVLLTVAVLVREDKVAHQEGPQGHAGRRSSSDAERPDGQQHRIEIPHVDAVDPISKVPAGMDVVRASIREASKAPWRF